MPCLAGSDSEHRKYPWVATASQGLFTPTRTVSNCAALTRPRLVCTRSPAPPPPPSRLPAGAVLGACQLCCLLCGCFCMQNLRTAGPPCRLLLYVRHNNVGKDPRLQAAFMRAGLPGAGGAGRRRLFCSVHHCGAWLGRLRGRHPTPPGMYQMHAGTVCQMRRRRTPAKLALVGRRAGILARAQMPARACKPPRG